MSDNTYTSRHVATLYSITKETVRAWSEEFAKFLSPTANPGRNKPRFFTQADLEVFSLVDELKGQGMTFSEIHAALENGQRGTAPVIEPEEVQAIVVTRREQQLALEVEFLQRSMAKLQQQYNETLAQLEEARHFRDENIQLRADLKYSEQRLQDLAQRLQAAEERIRQLVDERAQLHEEVGKSYARGVMDLLKKRGDLPED